MNKKVKLSVFDIAQYFIWKSFENRKKTISNKKHKFLEKNNVSNKKLQKLLYYAQVWYLAWYNKKLFENKIEAWVYGPVVNEVYQKYKHYGFNNIDDLSNFQEDKFLEEKKTFLNEIWRFYGKYSALYLEILTHAEEPWKKARKNVSSSERSRKCIDLEFAKKFYKDLYKKSKEKNGG